MGSSFGKSWAGVRIMFLVSACVLSVAGGLHAQNAVTFRPVDTGRSVTFSIDTGADAGYDRFAVKTNLLYWATLSPNLSLEAGLGRRTSLELTAGFSDRMKAATADAASLKVFKHFLVKPEFRYWWSERFSGHFAGLYAVYADYDVEGVKIYKIFDKGNSYKGNAFGAGLTYGYLWKLCSRWRAEFYLGVGVVRMKYDKIPSAGDVPDVRTWEKTYFGPTSAGMKIVFMIK